MLRIEGLMAPREVWHRLSAGPFVPSRGRWPRASSLVSLAGGWAGGRAGQHSCGHGAKAQHPLNPQWDQPGKSSQETGRARSQLGLQGCYTNPGGLERDLEHPLAVPPQARLTWDSEGRKAMLISVRVLMTLAARDFTSSLKRASGQAARGGGAGGGAQHLSIPHPSLIPLLAPSQ